jgi:8-oxo-dGTP diphosphatase/2-hydroxy-dATP diphosphatase
MKIFTLVLVLKKCGILLGLKKRGFGEGKWNGFGGKIESGESVIQAAIRSGYQNFCNAFMT